MPKAQQRGPDLVKVPEPSVAVRRQWTRRVEDEYRSAALVQHLVLWLMQLGAPRLLIDEGLSIVTDKLNHGDLCSSVCESAGCTSPPQIERGRLSLARSIENTLEFDALSACIGLFCLTDSAVVPLYRELRAGCTVPLCTKVFDAILRNEVRHRRFGWELLDHFLQTQPNARTQVQELLLPLLHQLRRRFCQYPGRATIGGLERAWGLMPVSLYSTIVEESIEDELRVRFAERGIAMPRR